MEEEGKKDRHSSQCENQSMSNNYDNDGKSRVAMRKSPLALEPECLLAQVTNAFCNCNIWLQLRNPILVRKPRGFDWAALTEENHEDK